MIIKEENYLKHYGILRRSGRYPWGSGGQWGTGGTSNPAQRSVSFFDAIAKFRSEGFSDPEIAKGLGMTTTELRSTTTLAKNQKKAADIAQATRLKATGMSNVDIGKEMHINESSVRSLLAPGQKEKLQILATTANMLRDQVAEKKFVQVGKGVENQLGISKEKFGTSLAILKGEGYAIWTVQVDQQGTQNKTSIKVLAPPGTTYRDVASNISAIKTIENVSDDGGRSYFGLLPPLPVSSKRLAIRYSEQGGGDADGVIYVRPGVKDLSIGNSRYAQVRINVDGTHYLKGMAMYKDDLPDGVDLMFNTNKHDTGNKLDALKPQTGDPDNPFGAMVRQIGEHDEFGNVKKLTSAMNLVNEEGKWEKWSRNLSSQTLSKQSPKLAKAQLEVTYERRRKELDEIMALTNPAVKKKLLKSYSDSVDAAAVHLKAAAIPRSSWHAILPFNKLKDNEIYAPNFRDGERVALIRYPHGGKFEIPELTVNNRHREARNTIGRAKDAVGINSRVAARLSGADFDGDAVLVIPNNTGSIKTSPALAGLKNFDPQSAYPAYDGMRTIDGGIYREATKSVDYGDKSPSPRGKATQMGLVSNLITDMTIRGATDTELAAAVRHSMVVIDAEKHNLNYKLSAEKNGIRNLMTKYQKRPTGGASTLISQAGSRVMVRQRKPRSASKGGPIDKATGKKVFEEVGESWVDAKGKVHFPEMRSKKLAETDDAHTLSSGTPIEKVYADHSNRLKALANESRKELLNTPNIRRSPSAAKIYADEVKSLDAKLNVALTNSPRERQAQVIASTIVSMKRQAKPDMDPTELKRVRAQALTEARIRTDARKILVEPTPREWEAIQAGAITNNKLVQILDNSKLERIKELATPRAKVAMSPTKTTRARQMVASGYTQAEIADALGVSLTTLKEGLK